MKFYEITCQLGAECPNCTGSCYKYRFESEWRPSKQTVYCPECGHQAPWEKQPGPVPVLCTICNESFIVS